MQDDQEVLLKIGHCLRELRMKKGYSSYEIFCYDNDLPRGQYWRLEKGVANFTIRSLTRVLKAHGLSIFEFMRLVERTNPASSGV